MGCPRGSFLCVWFKKWKLPVLFLVFVFLQHTAHWKSLVFLAFSSIGVYVWKEILSNLTVIGESVQGCSSSQNFDISPHSEMTPLTWYSVIRLQLYESSCTRFDYCSYCPRLWLVITFMLFITYDRWIRVMLLHFTTNFVKKFHWRPENFIFVNKIDDTFSTFDVHHEIVIGLLKIVTLLFFLSAPSNILLSDKRVSYCMYLINILKNIYEEGKVMLNFYLNIIN